jgi:PKD repeat protein
MFRIHPARVAIVTVALLVSCSPAIAAVSVEPTGEPAFTNTTTNTQFIRTSPPSGNSYDGYRLHLGFYVDGNLFTNEYPAVSTTQSQVVFANWIGEGIPSDTLLEGHRYGICGTPEWHDFAALGDNWIPESQNSCSEGSINNKLTNTVIDLTKPQISVSVDGAATYTNNPLLAYHVAYSDNLSPPFPADFICVAKGAPGTVCTGNTYAYDAPCSTVTSNPSPLNYTIDCSQNAGGAGDGIYNFCAIAADSAIPDNPNNPDQRQTADKANLSLSQCGYITLDRVAPTVTPSASKTTVVVGELVTFTAAGSDSSSGLNNQWAWTWGDNTAGGSGQSPTHTFTQAGTFSVSLGTADNAGNPGTGTVTMTVNPAPTTGGGTTGGGTTGGGTTGGGTTGGTASTGSSTGGSATTTPTAIQISQSSGGGGTQSTGVGSLGVLAPRSIGLSHKTLPLALTAQSAGRARFALVRGGRIVATGTLVITGPGTVGFKLKLPKGLRPGKYKLQVTFVATGQTKGITKSLSLTVKPAVKKRGRAASRPGVVSTGLPPASLGGGR